jgi:hypothetical protein
MKESEIIRKFAESKNQILQNNKMLQSVIQDFQDLQQTFAGFISVIRRLPGYDDVIKEMVAERAQAEDDKNYNDGLDLGEDEDASN